MNGSAKTFLHVSNALISLLCVAAIVCYLVLPVFTVRVRMQITPELAKAAASGLGEASAAAEQILNGLSNEGAEIGLTYSVSTMTLLRAIFGGGGAVVGDAADEAVDQIVASVGGFVDTAAPAAVKVYSESILKSQIVTMIREREGKDPVQNEEELDSEYEKIMNELGEDGKACAESLIERIVKAVMAEDATVDSVTETVMSSVDEAVQIVSESEKYAGYVTGFDADSKAELDSGLREFLKTFADGDGKLQMKEALLNVLLGAVSDELGGLTRTDAPSYTFTSLGSQKGSETSGQLTEKLRSQIKGFINKNLSAQVMQIIGNVFTVLGVLAIISMLMLAYPVIRTLTKIGAKNPGFNLTLPILGGIFPYTFAVILPAAATAAVKGAAASGAFNIPEAAVAAAKAVRIGYASGTSVAFIAAIIMLAFGFVYAHKRRELAKALKQQPVQRYTNM
ncbi:MAG: hypothetical protein J5585_04050 [Clostridia bacterium]|nr:hypothetical protein [Clostridia bacterium]